LAAAHGAEWIYVSATFWRDLGYAPGFEHRESARGLVPPADVRLATEKVGLHLLRQGPFDIEVRVRAADGEWRLRQGAGVRHGLLQ
jgi:hypothetical protein